MATKSNNSGKPELINQIFVVAASDFLISIPPEDDFDIEIAVTGKGKLLNLPDGSTLSLSPGLNVTFTNLENDKSISFGATGTFRTSADGTEVVANGHNLVFDPQPPGNGEGIFFTAGHFSFAFDSNGNLVEPLSGHGQQIEVISEFLF